jgi:hypothetical protein
MCNETVKRSDFYKDDEKRKEACEVLREMKNLRERRGQEMTTIILPNGARVSSTSSERLKEYEKYSKRKAGYFTQLK